MTTMSETSRPAHASHDEDHNHRQGDDATGHLASEFVHDRSGGRAIDFGASGPSRAWRRDRPGRT